MRWKWLVAVCVLIVVVLIASVSAYLNTYNYNKLKPRITRMVKDATGRELNIAGAIDLTIGFSPALVVRKVMLANAPWGSQPQMIKVEKIEAQVRLLPLLFRKVQLKRISLAGVDVLLEADQSGQVNWDFIAGNKSAGKTGVFTPKDIEIDNIRIEKLQFLLREGRKGSTKRITMASLDVAKSGAEDALTLDLKADYNGQPVTLSGKTGPIRLLWAKQRFPLELSGTFSNAKVVIAGTIDDILNLQGIDLKTDVSGIDLAALGFDKSLQLPKTIHFDVMGHLRGSTESLALNDISGNLSANDISLSFSGSISDLIALSGIDLRLNGSGQDLSEIGPIIGQKLPTTDKFSLKGTLTGSTKILSLTAAQGSADRGSVNLALSGAVKDVLAFSGVDLKLQAVGKDLAEVGPIIGEKLLVTDNFSVQGRLTGSAKALSLKEAQGRAKQGSSTVALSGEVKDLIAFSGLDLQLTGSGQNLAEIGLIIQEKLPATDRFAVEGRLMGSSKALSLLRAHGQAGQGSLNLTANGQVKDLLTLSGMDLRLKGSGKDLAEVGAIIGQKLPTTDEFALEARLTGSARSLSLQQAQGSVNRGNLNLMLSGGIEKLPALDGINFIVKASGKELAEIGPLVGVELPELGPFEVSGTLSGSAKTILLNEVLAIIEKSDFKGLAKLEFLTRPKITVRLDSSVIDFTALIKSLEKDSQKPANKDKQKRRLFSDDPLPFDILRKVDADIVLKARNIHAKDARLDFAHMALKLEDYDFSIDKLEATYKETKISGNLQINAGQTSQLATSFLVQNFNLGDFLKETGKSDQVRAIVDIAAHGKSRGDSVSSLMANLNGSIGAVMGEGYLTRYLDLLSVGLSGKVINFWGKHKKGGEIRCAIVQFDISNGIATSRAFVVDTEAGVLTVEGDINLATEKVDFLLVPEPRYPSLMHLWTKLRVSGTMIDPTVRPDALSLLSKGARALSALAIGPLGLLEPFVHLGANKNHPCDIQSVGQLGLNIPTNK